MSEGLFREEVVAARRSSWLGGISLAQPMALWIFTAFSAFAALAVSVFLMFGTYARRSTVSGQLVPTQGLATVLAPETGVVKQLDVAEGEEVSAGQALAVVAVPRATPVGGDTQQALERRLQQRKDSLALGQSAQREQIGAQQAGLQAQRAASQRELMRLDTEIATRRKQIDIADEVLRRYRQLEDAHYVSTLQIKQEEATALEYTSEMQALQQQADEIRRNIAQIDQSLHQLPGQQQAADASYQHDVAQLEQERVQAEGQSKQVVSAPVDGIVATQMAKPGESIQAGQPLMSVLPGSGELEAQLLVPSSAIGFVEPGDKVLLRYQAYPYQKFGHQHGWVEKISRSALSSGELGALIGNAQQGQPYYRVTVKLARQIVMAYGKPEALKPGMLLDADILGEKRRLIEWIFEPMYSIKGRMGD